MNLHITVSTREAETYLNGVHRNQIPFAASKALNDTGKVAQAAIRGTLGRDFILRRPDFILREGAKIPKFSTKERLELEIMVSERASFLAKFEKGVPKTPTRSLYLALPGVGARPTPRSLIPDILRPRRLALREPKTQFSRAIGGGRPVLRGRQRTFLIPGKGIFQRTGPGRAGVRLLFSFTPRPARIPASLHFERTVRTTVQDAWPDLFARAFALAIRTAR